MEYNDQATCTIKHWSGTVEGFLAYELVSLSAQVKDKIVGQMLQCPTTLWFSKHKERKKENYVPRVTCPHIMAYNNHGTTH